MSMVTSITIMRVGFILGYGGEEDDPVIAHIREAMSKYGIHFGIEVVPDDLPVNVSKGFEATTYVGVGNHIDEDELVAAWRSAPWDKYESGVLAYDTNDHGLHVLTHGAKEVDAS